MDESSSKNNNIAEDFLPIDINVSGGKEWLQEFQFSKKLNKTKCLLCQKQYSGCFLHNLKRHLISEHVSHAEMYDVNIKRKLPKQSEESQQSSKKNKDGKLFRGEYIKNCVLMAAVNMTAFLLFNSPFFRNLTLIHSISSNLIINSGTIVYFIELTAIAIRKKIISEIKNKLISIKIDIASRHNRSVMGINIQFYCQNRRRISVRTLGCIELDRSHTSSYLEQKVYEILSLYEIDRKNIYSYTSDNGSNMLCLGKLIRKMQHNLFLTQQWEEFKNQSSKETEDDFDDLEPDDVEFQFDYQDNVHAQTNAATTDELMKLLTDDQDSPLSLLIVFGCAAHTLQLAVHDVLKKIQKTSINCIRSVIKELKSSKYLSYYPPGFKSLKLNVCSRWNSLYMMFETIIKKKDSLKSLFERVPPKLLPDINLTDDDFQYMADFNEAFEPVYKLTLQLQSEQLAMSKNLTIFQIFFLNFRCKRDINKLKKDQNEFDAPLIEAFDIRSEQLMKNPLLATAVYVDPRLIHKKRSDDFLGELKNVAEQRLLTVVRRIKQNKAPFKVIEDYDEVTSDEDELERYIELEVSKTAVEVPERGIKDTELLQQIKRLGLQEKIELKSNIFGYYEDLKKKNGIDEDLFEAVMVVLAAPATQVSVERAFSALALLWDPIRLNLTSSTTDNILTIALNRHLINLVNFDAMDSPSGKIK